MIENKDYARIGRLSGISVSFEIGLDCRIKGGDKLKEFIGTFVFCLIISWILAFFIVFFLEHIYISATVFAFILALLITIFIKQESRIEELEKNVTKLLNNQQDSEE